MPVAMSALARPVEVEGQADVGFGGFPRQVGRAVHGPSTYSGGGVGSRVGDGGAGGKNFSTTNAHRWGGAVGIFWLVQGRRLSALAPQARCGSPRDMGFYRPSCVRRGWYGFQSERGAYHVGRSQFRRGDTSRCCVGASFPIMSHIGLVAR